MKLGRNLSSWKGGLTMDNVNAVTLSANGDNVYVLNSEGYGRRRLTA